MTDATRDELIRQYDLVDDTPGVLLDFVATRSRIEQSHLLAPYFRRPDPPGGTEPRQKLRAKLRRATEFALAYPPQSIASAEAHLLLDDLDALDELRLDTRDAVRWFTVLLDTIDEHDRPLARGIAAQALGARRVIARLEVRLS